MSDTPLVGIAQVMEDAALEMPINTDMILVRDGLYLHFGMHSDVVAYSQDSLERLIHKKQQHTKQVLENASHILITFGTAWIYEYGNDGQIVANAQLLMHTTRAAAAGRPCGRASGCGCGAEADASGNARRGGAAGEGLRPHAGRDERSAGREKD